MRLSLHSLASLLDGTVISPEKKSNLPQTISRRTSGAMTDAAANVAFFPRPCSGEFGMFNDVLPLRFLTSTLSRRLHQNSIVSSKTVLSIIIRKNLTSLDLLVRSLALPLFCVKFSVTRSLLDPSFSSLVLRRPRSYNFPFFLSLSLPFTCLHFQRFFHALLTKAHCSLDLCTKDLTSHFEKRSCTIVSFLYFFVLFYTLKHGFL